MVLTFRHGESDHGQAADIALSRPSAQNVRVRANTRQIVCS
jgi:hypothetical protein